MNDILWYINAYNNPIYTEIVKDENSPWTTPFTLFDGEYKDFIGRICMWRKDGKVSAKFIEKE